MLEASTRIGRMDKRARDLQVAYAVSRRVISDPFHESRAELAEAAANIKPLQLRLEDCSERFNQFAPELQRRIIETAAQLKTDLDSSKQVFYAEPLEANEGSLSVIGTSLREGATDQDLDCVDEIILDASRMVLYDLMGYKQ